MHSGPAVFGLLRNPKILNVVESVVGPEIYTSPVQQMRMKPPEKTLSGNNAMHSNVGKTTWHQDIVALLPEADDTFVLTVWVAITEASEKNGCLVSVPGSHRHGPMTHCSNAELASEPQVPPAPHGRARRSGPAGKTWRYHSVDKLNIHSALPSRSESMRWSVDLRYQRTGEATGRPAFPGFVARSRANLESELHDPEHWAARWEAARKSIITGGYEGRIFEDTRWNNSAVC
ncbi:MAG: phytanoyl-CoA dioxygenase family protein [Hyphomicrobiales bacterium]